MKNAIVLVFIVLFACSLNAQQKYNAADVSLRNYKAPEWYEDAKLGFWVHWGVYSVPAFKGDHAAEWYGNWMYSHEHQGDHDTNGYATHLHHLKKYGDPSIFGYKDFIPMWKAEKFNADEWAELCVRGGAKFFTMMGVHADNFCLWDSEVTKWNAMDMGPRRDLVGEMAKATRKAGLKFGVSNHEWGWMFFSWNHVHGYDAKQPGLEALYGSPIIDPKLTPNTKWHDGEDRSSWLARTRSRVQPSEFDIDLWAKTTTELADLYQPDLYYFDWTMNPEPFKSSRDSFIVHYYNQAIKWGKGKCGDPGVVINYKGNAYPKGSAVLDFERGGMSDIAERVWQTDDCVFAGHNWSYADNETVKPTNEIVDELMDVVSKNGVLLLSFGPKADGTFPENQKKLIYELGNWLKICGEAVYATRSYTVFGELPEGVSKKKEYGAVFAGSSEDIRFTRNKNNTILFATVLDWPRNNTLLIKSLAGANLVNLKSVRLLGSNGKIKYKQTVQGLEIKLPDKPSYDYAYPVRLEFIGKIPSIVY